MQARGSVGATAYGFQPAFWTWPSIGTGGYRSKATVGTEHCQAKRERTQQDEPQDGRFSRVCSSPYRAMK